MPSKPRPLSPGQKVQIDRVRAAKSALTLARDTIEMEVRMAAQERLNELEVAYALTIRQAYMASIPKRRIGIDGMGTSDPSTVNRWLARTEKIAAVADGAVVEADNTMRWLDDTKIRVSALILTDPWNEWRNMPPLTGVVELDPLGADDKARRSGFIVLADQSDGFFTDMITKRSPNTPGSLPAALVEWIASNPR